MPVPTIKQLAASALGATLIVVTSAPVRAQDVETWRCNAGYGHFDQRLLMMAGQTVVTGRIQLHSIDKGPRWGSQAKVSLEDSQIDNGECNCAGLIARGYNAPDAVDFGLVQGENDTYMSKRTMNTPITFRIEIDPRGPMTVTIGKEHPTTMVAKLAHPRRDMIALSCSGADVSFFNIQAH